MQVDVVPPADLAPADVAQWRALLAAPGAFASPFLGPGFAAAVGRVRDDVRVVVGREDGRAVAFLALHLGDDGRARPVGDGLADAGGPVLAGQVDPRALLRATGARRVAFDHLVPAAPAWSRWQVRTWDSPVVDLPEGVDAWRSVLASRSGSLLTTAARKARGLARDHGELRAELSTSGDVLEQLRRWKSAQYLRTEQWDRFDVPWISRLLDVLLEQDAQDCQPVLVSLYAGDTLVAAHFGVRSESRLAWWFPAYDPELSRSSPGVQLLLDVVAQAAATGVTAVDLGRGDESYKRRFSTSEVVVGEGFVPLTVADAAAWRLRNAAVRGRAGLPPGVKRLARRTVLRSEAS